MAKKQKNDATEERPAWTTEERQAKAQQALDMVIERLIENLISGRKDPAKLNGTELSMLVRVAEGRLCSGKTVGKPGSKMAEPVTQLERLLTGAGARPQSEPSKTVRFD